MLDQMRRWEKETLKALRADTLHWKPPTPHDAKWQAQRDASKELKRALRGLGVNAVPSSPRCSEGLGKRTAENINGGWYLDTTKEGVTGRERKIHDAEQDQTSPEDIVCRTPDAGGAEDDTEETQHMAGASVVEGESIDSEGSLRETVQRLLLESNAVSLATAQPLHVRSPRPLDVDEHEVEVGVRHPCQMCDEVDWIMHYTGRSNEIDRRRFSGSRPLLLSKQPSFFRKHDDADARLVSSGTCVPGFEYLLYEKVLWVDASESTLVVNTQLAMGY